MFLQKPKRRKTILFLCTGDTCRGPMAAGYMRKVLEERNLKDAEVRSAGVMTATGLLSTPEAIQLLEGVGVDLKRHRSSQLTPELVRKADLILGMTPFHVQFALRMSEDAKDKTFLFKEFTGSDPKNYQITDPMGHTLEVYKRVFREIRQACEYLAEKEILSGKAPEKPKTKTPKKPPTKKKTAAGGAGKPKTSKPSTAAAKPSTSAKPKTTAKPATSAKPSTSAKPPSHAKPVAKSAASAKSSAAAKPSKPTPTPKAPAKKDASAKSGKSHSSSGSSKSSSKGKS